jgi:lactose/L-arabinose transport system ATP-binding protein
MSSRISGRLCAYARAGEEQPLTIELRDAAGVAEGGMIETGFEPADAFLFDPGNGARIR